jgi:concanavalin A-like lectin/glucanase superfamily protein/VanZ like protein
VGLVRDGFIGASRRAQPCQGPAVQPQRSGLFRRTRTGARCPTRAVPTLPVIVAVLAFTAVPSELRSPSSLIALREAIDVKLNPGDIVANVIGYVPVGVVLGGRSLPAGVAVASSMSLLAESVQLLAKGRFPSPVDIATNLAGAILGYALSRRLRRVIVPLNTTTAAVAAIVAVVCAATIVWSLQHRVTPRMLPDRILQSSATLMTNDRGAKAPGRLEAHWSFDEGDPRRVIDSSDNALTATSVDPVSYATGIHGAALRLSEPNPSIGFADPLSLRLAGSMTVSAWIRPSMFPRDDAAILSTHNGLGFQLDTTIDRGPRTVALKLADAAGHALERYGRTPLGANQWYHVAGVYDATARTLDVYLNGRIDNGCVLGEVGARQRPSGQDGYIGRRADKTGYEFRGLIDEIRVYSRALSSSEILVDIQEDLGAAPPPWASLRVDPRAESEEGSGTCPNRPVDGIAWGSAAALGMGIAMSVVSLWPAGNGLIAAVLSGLAGFVVLGAPAASGLTSYNWWLFPVLTLIGGAAAASSTRD